MITASTHRVRAVLAAAAPLLVLLLAAPTAAQLRPLAEDRGASGLGLKLRKIESGVSVLTITAHPDDENNALHARLSRGMGARVSLLTLTRGGGGQNEIGPELFDGLRILRTEELLTSHRLDAVEQFFGMVSDFGYSFSVEETLKKWGHEETLGEVVRMIRTLRPDVILTLPPAGEGGGQHHQATGRITIEAFDAAGDAERFPEHRELGLRPWQPLKLFVGGVGGGTVAGDRVVRVDTAIWDPLLGRTYADLGQEARSAHRCQGMGQVRGAPASGPAVLVEMRNLVSETGENDLFPGIPVGLERLRAFVHGDPDAVVATERALGDLERAVGGAQWAFSSTSPHESIPALREALIAARRVLQVSADLDPGAVLEIRHRVAPKEVQIQEALALAHGLLTHPVADAGEVVPGGSFGAEVFVQAGGSEPLTLTGISIETPDGWETGPNAQPPARGRGSRSQARPVVVGADFPVEMATGDAVRASFRVTAAADATLSRQVFDAAPGRDRFVASDPSLFGAAAPPSPVRARVDFETDDIPASVTLPVAYRYGGPFVGTEKQKEVSVLPLAAVRVTPPIVVFPRGQRTRSLSVRVTWRSVEEAEVEVGLDAPSGWEVRPASATLRFSGPGEQGVAFEATVPAGVADGGYRLAAEVRLADGTVFGETVETIAYHHIETRYRFRPAEALARVLDATVAPVKVAWVEGVGDEVAEAIGQLGVSLTFLDEEDLAEGDLSRFDTIVLGVRAYLARPDLRTYNQRLLDFVADGGTLLVQYNKFEFNAGPWAPSPIRVGRGRITDENAPMQVLVPDHPVFLGPNRIGPADWDGWVQERGLYFLETGDDPAAIDLLASEDPFPYNAGEKRGILVEIRHGEGRWLYLGLGLWRQLPEGTPGAYRLLANLLSLGYRTNGSTEP